MKTENGSQRTYDPERTREALVEAAIELFGKKGFRGTSVQELVNHAGLTKGAFYHHYESKEDVFHVIHDEFIDETLRRQEVILEMFDTAHERLYHLLLMLVGIVVEYRPNVEIFFQEKTVLQHDGRFAEVFEKRDKAMRRYVDAIKLGVDNGEFRPDVNPRLAAFGLLGMCDWTYQWYRPGGRASGRQIAETFARMGLHSLTTSPELVEEIAARTEPVNY